MVRDFSQKTVQELYETIRVNVDEEEQWKVFDFVEDFFMEELEIGDYINDINSYHLHMFDKHDVTTKKFDAIVEKAGKVDANYAAQIEGYCSLLGEYGKKFEAVCAMLQPEKLRLSPDKYREKLEGINTGYQNAKDTHEQEQSDYEAELYEIETVWYKKRLDKAEDYLIRSAECIVLGNFTDAHGLFQDHGRRFGLLCHRFFAGSDQCAGAHAAERFCQLGHPELHRYPAQLVGDRKMGLIKYVMSLMNAARLGIGAQSVGLCEAAYREALKYANERAQFGKNIIRFAAISEMLSNMKAKTQGVRALLYETTRFVEIYKQYTHISHERPLEAEERQEMKYYNKLADGFTPLLKLFSSEYANQMAYDAIQIHGGSGFMKDYACERLYRDARIMNIYEGTSQLQVVAAINHVTKGTYLEQIKRYPNFTFS